MRRNPPPVPLLAVLAGAGAAAYAAYHVRGALVPFVLAFALAYLANPVVNLFEARGLRRDHTVTALYLVIAAGVSVAATFLLPTVTSELALLQSQVPTYLRRSQEYLAAAQLQVARHVPFGQALVRHWSLRMYEPLVDQLQHVPGYLLGLVPFLSLLFLVPFITFFLLMDSAKAIRKAIQLCPSRHVEQALYLLCEIDTTLGNYLRGVLIVAIAIAIASFVGLTVLGLDYALAIATLAGLLSFIPYAGAIVGMVVGSLVALFQFKSAVAAAQVVLLFLGIRLADEMLLQPVVSRHSIHLHPVFYLFALMAGGELFGFAGLLFAVPAACVLKVFFALLWDWYAGEARPAPAMEEARVPYV